MKNFNFRQVKAIEQKNKAIILNQCSDVPDTSGIYILTREENGFKYAYIGQAKKLLTRLASHLKGYQHIDLSIRKHGFYSRNNENGWMICWLSFPEEELNNAEQKYISEYANLGFQLRNKTSGSQGKGKTDIAENITKGYIEGLHKGYERARKEVAHLFDLHLDYSIKGKPTKNKDKAMLKFSNFISREEEANGID